MATVSGVWKWNNPVSIKSSDNFNQSVNFTSNGASYSSISAGFVFSSNNPEIEKYDLYLEYDSTRLISITQLSTMDYYSSVPEQYELMDFGTTEQTVSDTFYTYLTANAVQQASPSVPTPDWANCFAKTSVGNKAVEKVWIKQNGQLVTVYDVGGGGAAVNFATDSWETISAACKDGSYKTVYSVGDTKDIELSTGETITVAIMGFDHDDLSDGSGKAPITLGMTELLATTYPMNSTNTNVGGWDDCLMRTSTMATLLAQLPSDLQAVIKSVDKKATSGSRSTTITTSSDKLFIFSEVEIDGTTSSGYAREGKQYDYWKTVKDGEVAADRIKYLSNGGGSAVGWWLRSPHVNNSTAFRYIGSAGGVYTDYASKTYGVSFGFCVG